jgi:hypothetical protein
MIDEDVIVIKSREELKALAEKNTSPCAKCLQTEGCPAPAYCKKYQQWRKNRKRGIKHQKPGK